MGCGGSTANPEQDANNKNISKQLNEDRKKMETEIKMLLLGTKISALLQ